MTTQRIMVWVALTLLPGLGLMIYGLGLGVVWNVALLVLFCVVIEAISLRLTSKPLHTLLDGTALVSALLLGICLPPWMPLPVLLLAAAGAIGLAKHVYGGTGRNVFNPAMVGYAVVLVSFPGQLANWPNLAELDAMSGATLLTEFRFRDGLTTDEFAQAYATSISFQTLLSAGFAAGGLVLVYLKIVAWRIPAAMIAGVFVSALFGYDQGASTSLGSGWFHLTTGGFAAAAFFIATDPVTHPRAHWAQIFYAFSIGVLIYCMRGFGTFPDGIAFAVLFGNCLTPLLNRIAARKMGEDHSRAELVERKHG